MFRKTTRGRHLNNFENSFNEPCKDEFQSINDDKIIDSVHLIALMHNSMYFTSFDILIKILRAHRPLDPGMSIII